MLEQVVLITGRLWVGRAAVDDASFPKTTTTSIGYRILRATTKQSKWRVPVANREGKKQHPTVMGAQNGRLRVCSRWAVDRGLMTPFGVVDFLIMFS